MREHESRSFFDLVARIGQTLARRASWEDGELAARQVAALIAEHLDGCVVDVVDRSGKCRRVALSHRDPQRAAALAALPPLVEATDVQGGLTVFPLDGAVGRFGAMAVDSARPLEPAGRDALTDIAHRLSATLEIARLLGERRRSQAITANATLGLVMLDGRQHCTFLNPAAEQIFGLRLDQVQGKPLHDFVHHTHPDGRHYPIEDCPIDRALPTRMQETGEDVFVRPDGTFYPVRFTASPIIEHGAPVGTVIEVQDITTELRLAAEGRRLQSEQHVMRSELETQVLRSNAITTNATLGLVMMDTRQHCTFMNPAAERIFGLRLDQVQGKPLHDFVHHTHPDGRHYPIEECPIDRALPTRMQETGEDVFVRPDGTFYPVRFTASPLIEHGVATGTVIEVQDITDERRRLAEQHRRAAQALLIGEVGTALTKAATLRATLQRCAEALVRHFSAAFARIWTLADGATTLELQASAGMYTHLDGPHARVPVGMYKIGRIAEHARPHLSNDVPNDPEVGDHAWARREGMVAFAGHPLVVDGRVVGVMAVFAREPLAAEAIAVLGAVADAIAVGIERAHTADARHESETRYRFATQATKDAIWDWNLVTNAVAWNEGIESMFGHPLATIPGEASWWIERIHPSDRERVSHEIHHAIDHGAHDWQSEYQFERADGSFAIVTDRGFIHRDPTGAPVRMVGAMQDVTERRTAERGWRFLAEAAGLLGKTLDPTSVLRHLAQASVPEHTDWSAVDLLSEDGAVVRIAVAHSDPEKVHLAFEIARRAPPTLEDAAGVGRVLRTGEPEVVESLSDELLRQVVQDDESFLQVQALGLKSYIIIPIKLEGRTIGALTWVQAESRRRFSASQVTLATAVAERAAIAFDNARLYAELRSLNANLERRVDERTAELQDVNEQLESFTYSVSHDLRAPLRHIGGFAKLLERRAASSLDDKGREFVTMIVDAAHRGGQLVDDLLAFSRLGRAELKKAVIDLDALVREVCAELAPDTEGRSVTWQIGTLPRVHGDPALLRSVLKNLFANALKYTRPRAETIVEVGAHEHEREYEIFVKDNGVGFDMAYADKLFGVFQRLHREQEFEGTGIGLANVRRIVHRHGGRSWGVGEVDQGATFSITLPKQHPTPHRGPREPTNPSGRR